MKKNRLILTALLSIFTANLQAHPHAFISMKTKPLVQDKYLQGFAVEWKLDEASSSEILYDLRIAEKNPKAKQTLANEIMQNVVSEHYFSYLYDKQGNKIKYSSKPQNYGLRADGLSVVYYFDFMLSKPQLLTDSRLTLEIYDPTYYVSMYYEKPSVVDFSSLPHTCRGEMIDPNVDEKTREYAQALDRSQREADYSLGAVFAQKVIITCQ